MKPRVIILTGLSGSGKTVALRAFEDCGYFCTDNLPPALIDEFIKISAAEGLNSIAIGVDIREKTFLAGIDSTISRLKSTYNFETVFLEAEIETLLRRFKETRRPHPLAGRGGDIRESIRSESSALQPLRDLSDRIVDTTSLSPHQLRDTIRTMFCSVRHDKMHVIITSFGYKFGIPSNADLVFDVRFLPNPHFVTELRELTGTDRPVKEFVFQDDKGPAFLSLLREILDFLIPLYIKEGKSYLNICIGCTGGRHRSVAIAEELIADFRRYPVSLETVHRDI